MKTMKRMVQALPGLSLLAVVWLVSAIEFGVAGAWAKWCVAGIVLIWVCMIAYIKWLERDKQRRQERKKQRIAARIIDNAEKAYYIRKTNAA